MNNYLLLGGSADGTKVASSNLRDLSYGYRVATHSLRPPKFDEPLECCEQVKYTLYLPIKLRTSEGENLIVLSTKPDVLPILLDGYLATENNIPPHEQDFITYASLKEVYTYPFERSLKELNIPIPDKHSAKYKLLLAVWLKGIKSYDFYTRAS